MCNLKLNKQSKHTKTETITQSKTLDFSDTTIFCGIDVHKKNWRVNIQDSEFELEDFSQNRDPVLLYISTDKKIPRCKIHSML